MRQLRAVGVEIEPVFVGPGFFTQLLPSGKFDIALFAWLNSGGFVWPEAKCPNVQNWTGFCSRLVMRDAQQVDSIVDPRQRARVLNAVDRKLVSAVPALPVVQPVLRAAIRSTVRGVEPGGTQFHFSQNSEDWWLAEPR
jgi:ABC-type transport system substrate-binding protein